MRIITVLGDVTGRSFYFINDDLTPRYDAFELAFILQFTFCYIRAGSRNDEKTHSVGSSGDVSKSDG